MTRSSLRLAIVAALAAATCGVLPASATAAAPATIDGKLEPAAAKLPSSARAGRAQVAAMNIDTGLFGDATSVGRNGRYALQLPAGKWALLSSVVGLGQPTASFLSAAILTRAGQHRALPLTLKKFQKPRRKKRKRHGQPAKPRAHAANVNPKDGMSYKGEAFSLRYFNVAGAAELKVLGKGITEMLTVDLLDKPECEFSLVEWERREALQQEIALSKTGLVDPGTRVEDGHQIDPEIFIRGRIEERPGTPRRTALIAWLEDAKTGARLSGEVSVVDLYDNFFIAEERFAQLILRDLICARTRPAAAAPVAGTANPPAPPPRPVANTYSGTFAGSSDAVEQHWNWTGEVLFDAAQDAPVGPYGAPPGSYRLFSVTRGGLDIQTTGGDADCGWSGAGHLDLVPGFANGGLWVQLDTPQPAYSLTLSDTRTLTVNRSGSDPECKGTVQLPVPEPWAQTVSAHLSSSTTLEDSEAHITPQTFDFDYTTNWRLAPG